MLTLLHEESGDVGLADAEIFECIRDWEPNKADAGLLPLKTGDRVTVFEQKESGWCAGYKDNEMEVGWFPRGFLKPMTGGSDFRETVHSVSSPVRGDRGRAHLQDELISKANKEIQGLKQELARAEERAGQAEAAVNDKNMLIKDLKTKGEEIMKHKAEDAKRAEEQIQWLKEKVISVEEKASKTEEQLSITRKHAEELRRELYMKDRDLEAHLRRFTDLEGKASHQKELFETEVRQLKDQLRQAEEANREAAAGPRRLCFANEGARNPTPPLPRPEAHQQMQSWAPMSARQSVQSSPTRHQQAWPSPRGASSQPVKTLVQDFERRAVSVSREPSLQRYQHYGSALPTSGTVATVSQVIRVGSAVLRASSQEAQAQIPRPAQRTLQTSASVSEEHQRCNLGMSPIKRHVQAGPAITRSPPAPAPRNSLVKELRSKFEHGR